MARALSLLCCAVLTGAVTVTIEDGTLKGYTNGTINVFRGVPFAAPPTGNNRWRPPTQVTPWQGVRDATEDRPQCLEVHNPYDTSLGMFNKSHSNTTRPVGVAPMSEDCLFLTVFAPATAKKAAVMVWLHGGAFEFGAGTQSFYAGSMFTQQAKNVILVTINYRLHVFGFLASEALRDRCPDGSTGNYGIQDQRMALTWVQRNIGAFGGDPDNVLIFGESAGGASVATHMAAPKSWWWTNAQGAKRRLFHKAIMQSGDFGVWASQPLESATLTFDHLMNGTGCKDVACLLAIPADKLNTLGDKFVSPCIYHANFQPTVDGVELTKPQWQLLEDGAVYAVPTLLGSNKDEGAAFNTQVKMTEDEYRSIADHFLQTIDPDVVQKKICGDLYASSNYKWIFGISKPYRAFIHVYGDFAFVCSARRSARLLAKKVPTYMYFFEKYCVIPTVEWMGPLFSYHSAEIPYVFLQATDTPQLGTSMHAYWTNFATSADPNTGGLSVPAQWPRFAPQQSYLSLDTKIAAKTDLLPEKCDLWDSYWHQLADGCTLPGATANRTR